MTILASYISLFLNTAIIIDLKQVINNPFAGSEKRIKQYIIAGVSAGFVFCIIGLNLTKSTNTTLAAWNYRIY